MTSVQPDIRHALHRRLDRHNRRIGALRVIVPAAGVALVAVFAVQIGVSMLGEVAGVAGIRLEADTLVIDSPRFEGRTATGTVYRMTAERAESRIGDLDVTDLHGLTVDLAGGATYRAQARFSSAQWTMSREHLTSNEDVQVSDSTGASGVLAGVEVDWPAQIVYSDGPIVFDFDSGTRLRAVTMVHDMGAAIWNFTTVSVDMVPVPDAGADRDPHLEDQH